MPESKPKNEAKTPTVKADDPKTAPTAGEKKPDTPPKGVRITQVLADRLEKPSEDDLKKIPQGAKGSLYGPGPGAKGKKPGSGKGRKG